MRLFNKLGIVAAAAFLAVAFAVSSASAESLLVASSRIVNDSGTNTHFLQALNDAGATQLVFNTTVPKQLVKITYNAECGVLGPAGSWLSVTILVDGLQANPKNGTDFAFCTATSATTFSWMGAVRQSFISLGPVGAHKLTVLVDLNVGATKWWIGDSSVVIEAQ